MQRWMHFGEGLLSWNRSPPSKIRSTFLSWAMARISSKVMKLSSPETLHIHVLSVITSMYKNLIVTLVSIETYYLRLHYAKTWGNIKNMQFKNGAIVKERKNKMANIHMTILEYCKCPKSLSWHFSDFVSISFSMYNCSLQIIFKLWIKKN